MSDWQTIPDYMFTSRLGCEYDTDAECPRCRFGGEVVEVVQR